MSVAVINDLLKVFILALMPIAECRVSIPVGYLLLGQDITGKTLVITVSLIGNLLIPIIVLPLLKRFELTLLKERSGYGRVLKTLAQIYIKAVENVRRRVHKYISKWGYLGLVIFVALPLPGSGAWTGCLAAHVLGLDVRRSIISISLGVLIAASLITLSVETGIKIFYTFRY